MLSSGAKVDVPFPTMIAARRQALKAIIVNFGWSLVAPECEVGGMGWWHKLFVDRYRKQACVYVSFQLGRVNRHCQVNMDTAFFGRVSQYVCISNKTLLDESSLGQDRLNVHGGVMSVGKSASEVRGTWSTVIRHFWYLEAAGDTRRVTVNVPSNKVVESRNCLANRNEMILLLEPAGASICHRPCDRFQATWMIEEAVAVARNSMYLAHTW